MANTVVTMICGCCTAPIDAIPADWATARRIAAREVKVGRHPHDRCEDCARHDVYAHPCEPADFTPPRCDCGCAQDPAVPR